MTVADCHRLELVVHHLAPSRRFQRPPVRGLVDPGHFCLELDGAKQISIERELQEVVENSPVGGEPLPLVVSTPSRVERKTSKGHQISRQIRPQ